MTGAKFEYSPLIGHWSRLESSEPNAGDDTRKICPLYFITYAFILNISLLAKDKNATT